MTENIVNSGGLVRLSPAVARRSRQDKAEEGAETKSCRDSNARLGSLVYPEGDGSHGRA